VQERCAVDEPITEIPQTFTIEQAVSWLRSVDGDLYRTPPSRDARRAWVAVVRTPRFGTRRGQLIIAMGDTALEAASAAASQWRAVWESVPRDA
jgi:hypothetical protein